jgi:hypothetical protein
MSKLMMLQVNQLMGYTLIVIWMVVLLRKDKYRFHKPADVFYGVNTSFTYKNFDFGMSSWGNYNYNNVDSNRGSFQNILLRETDLFKWCCQSS